MINSVAIVGSGNVATHLAKAIFDAGVDVKYIYSPTLANSSALASKVNAVAVDSISEIKRDIDLITSNIHQNINNEELENVLLTFFDKDSELSNNIVYKGICFIGFDYNKYPTKDDITKTTNDIKDAILAEYGNWHNTLGEQIKTHINLDKKEIHIFLMPFPSVEDFRKHYLETIK